MFLNLFYVENPFVHVLTQTCGLSPGDCPEPHVNGV